jgi:cytochrome oxidase Cu insertion factor (SCO1/SenC/PrrC family)
MGEVNKITAFALRHPLATGLLILTAVALASLITGSLAGVIHWDASTESVGMTDAMSQATADSADKLSPADSVVSSWKPKAAPDFTLMDQDGQRVSLSGSRGKVVLVNFFFTHCEEVCLQMTREMRGLQEHFGKRMGRELVFLSITLDPAHDNPRTLKLYGRQHDLDSATWRLLTGSPEQIAALRNSFGIYAETTTSKSGHPDIAHTANAYVIDRNGVIVAMIPPGALTLFGAAAVERILAVTHG